jgi:carboxylesterase type B
LNGCSAGSESVWWQLTTKESWPYFSRIVTVGIGLNRQNDLSHADWIYDLTKEVSGCSDNACLRNLDNMAIRDLYSEIKKKVDDEVIWPNPIKITLYELFHPVVDGKYLKGMVKFCANQVRKIIQK